MSAKKFKPCMIIPCYRHVSQLTKNIQDLLKYNVFIYVVDDGNTEDDKKELTKALENLSNVELISLSENQGKGGAMAEGFKKAYEAGFSHALQIDADGQQNSSKIPSFLYLAQKYPDHLINGIPVYSDVPKLRLISRYITHFWVSVETGICQVIDTMCGMRVYPLDKVNELLEHRKIGLRMDFDTEIFVRLYWMGTNFIKMPVEIVYPKDGVSNFAPLRDNVLISLMHTKLCVEKTLHFWSIHKRKYR